MIPISFPEANGTLNGGDARTYKTENDVIDLPVHRTSDGQVISCWTVTDEERLQLLRTDRVWLSVLAGQTHHPVMLLAESPFGTSHATGEWPQPPDGESLHRATLDLYECAKSHERGSRLLGNVTAANIMALCEYSLNYAFKNARAATLERERDDAQRELSALKESVLFALKKACEPAADDIPGSVSAQLDRILLEVNSEWGRAEAAEARGAQFEAEHQAGKERLARVQTERDELYAAFSGSAHSPKNPREAKQAIEQMSAGGFEQAGLDLARELAETKAALATYRCSDVDPVSGALCTRLKGHLSPRHWDGEGHRWEAATVTGIEAEPFTERGEGGKCTCTGDAFERLIAGGGHDRSCPCNPAYDVTPVPAETAGETDERRGLYRKYEVKRLNDPTGKHADCEYFILDLVHDAFAGPALRAYATACEQKYPELALDLRRRWQACVDCCGDGLAPRGGPCSRCGGSGVEAAGPDAVAEQLQSALTRAEGRVRELEARGFALVKDWRNDIAETPCEEVWTECAEALEALLRSQPPLASSDCGACHKCLGGKPLDRMVVCPTCGNKRCPKATDHALACTGSNEPGQPGSYWEGQPPLASSVVADEATTGEGDDLDIQAGGRGLSLEQIRLLYPEAVRRAEPSPLTGEEGKAERVDTREASKWPPECSEYVEYDHSGGRRYCELPAGHELPHRLGLTLTKPAGGWPSASNTIPIAPLGGPGWRPDGEHELDRVTADSSPLGIVSDAYADHTGKYREAAISKQNVIELLIRAAWLLARRVERLEKAKDA